MTKIVPIHTDTPSRHGVYHDQAECKYGREITAAGNDRPGTGGRRRCKWCNSFDDTCTSTSRRSASPR